MSYRRHISAMKVAYQQTYKHPMATGKHTQLLKVPAGAGWVAGLVLCNPTSTQLGPSWSSIYLTHPWGPVLKGQDRMITSGLISYYLDLSQYYLQGENVLRLFNHTLLYSPS